MPRLRWFKRPELDHLSLRLVALFLAVVLWFLAMDRPNTTLGTERRTIHVETRVEGAGPGIDVVQLPESVAVTVEGPRLLLPVQAGSVEAYVDVSGRGAGRHRLPVQVRVPANVNVTAVNPQEVDVVLEEIAEKRVPVRASVLGKGRRHRCVSKPWNRPPWECTGPAPGWSRWLTCWRWRTSRPAGKGPGPSRWTPRAPRSRGSPRNMNG